eukprot:IDg22804t1
MLISSQAMNTASDRRGSNFIRTEDVAVANAWLFASENAVVGTKQTWEKFYSKITALYNEASKPANRELRSFESIRVCTKTILKNCVRLSACYTG